MHLLAPPACLETYTRLSMLVNGVEHVPQKKPGNPQIDLLCTLHLFEADYNLLLKWHSSKGFMAKVECNPWYGAGQGAGNACAHWIVQSNSMILVYNTCANPWCITRPDYSTPLHLGLDTFIDDTDLMATATLHQSSTTSIQKVQHNLTLWHDLLKTSGGSLNHFKCVWLYFYWKQDA